MIYFKRKKRNQGQVMIFLVILFMVISLIIIMGIINPILGNIKTVTNLFLSKQSLFLADAGMSDAIHRIKNNLQISNQELLSLDDNDVIINIIETIDGKTITSSSDYLDYVRNIEVRIMKGSGVSFFYGVQTGEGGITMSGNSEINGNVYSNGSIVGGKVTGTAISATTTIVGINDVNVGTDGVGDAWAYQIEDSNIQGDLKCQIGNSNNKDCNTAFPNPNPVAMPIAEEQILEWKAEAEAGDTIYGNYSPTENITLGPIRITGDLNVKKEIIMTGTIWVEGKLSFSNTNSKIILDSDIYDNKSGIIIVDKNTSFSGGSQILSTGDDNSYVMVLVTSDCPLSSFCNSNPAISTSGGAGSVILTAPYGTIKFGGSSNTHGVVANKVIMEGTTIINYKFGLANLNFVSGPSGSYYVTGFRETE